MNINPNMAETALPSGFEALYVDNYDFLWRCALRLGATPTDVEDVVQETFIVALRRYDPAGFEVPGAARPSTWLFAILHNVLRNHARSERRRLERLEQLAIEAPRPPPLQAEVSLGLRVLDEFLLELEPDQRAVFVLSDLEGMRGPEIARALGVNPNTIRSRLRLARQAFERRFGDERGALVERAAEVSAPPEACARGLAVLALPLVPAPIAAKGSLGLWIAAHGWWGAAIGSVVLVGAVAVGSSSPREQVELPLRVSESNETRPSAHPTVRVEPPTAPIVVQADSPKPRRAAPQSPSIEVDDRETEARDRLGRARRALLDGDAATALTLVEASGDWPETLDAHRIGLEIGALCALGRSDHARDRAQAWQRAHPDASTAIPLRAACWDDNSSGGGGHAGP
jgi:RNA polymerase sigma factor (sigma-70 family)